VTGAGCGIPPMGLVFDGDSLTRGNGITPYPTQVAAQIATPLNWWNVAIPGATITQMIASAPASVDRYAHPEVSSPPWAVIIWGGGNDWGSSSPATVHANIKAYCEARKAAGWKVVVL